MSSLCGVACLNALRLSGLLSFSGYGSTGCNLVPFTTTGKTTTPVNKYCYLGFLIVCAAAICKGLLFLIWLAGVIVVFPL
jgi:hypothetical protein